MEDFDKQSELEKKFTININKFNNTLKDYFKNPLSPQYSLSLFNLKNTLERESNELIIIMGQKKFNEKYKKYKKIKLPENLIIYK